MNKKDILFLCQFFHPEYNSSATLPFDTARYLAAQGFIVDALVGYPKEYSIEKNLPLKENVDGVDIKRLKYIQMNRVGKIGRLINYFSFTIKALINILYLKNYKTVIVYSNPPILPIVPILAKKLYGTRFAFVAYDIYPEVAYASGTLTPDSAISKMMNYINRKLYRDADYIVALTDEMKEFLLRHRLELSKDRIVTIPNWAHENVSLPNHEAYERFGYKDGQFVVSYFGNMGTCQDVETMMQAAELLKNNEKIKFLIVGHGNKKEIIAARIKEHEMKNVQLLGFLTGEDFQKAVAISSCCIVSLEKGLKGTCAPSKYYSYIKGGKPVLAVVENDSYLAEEIRKERIGYSVEIGDGVGLKEAILSIARTYEDCVDMGNRAQKLYIEKYSYDVAMKKYETIFTEICNK